MQDEISFLEFHWQLRTLPVNAIEVAKTLFQDLPSYFYLNSV